jgi:hypothetical protein
MPRLIKTFTDGSRIEYDTGNFDGWCVYVIENNQRNAPKDEEYFGELQALSRIYPGQQIYDDFVRIYNETNSTISPHVLRLIEELSARYQTDALHIEKLFTILYAGMVAEENKDKAILKKRMKRLGVYQILVENIPPSIAANFSKGKNWRELTAECTERGF